MGILGRLGDRLSGVRIIEANASGDLDWEWLRSGFSKMVVGESHQTRDFMAAYSPFVWGEAKRRTAREVRDMVVVELRREPENRFDSNAIAVWCLGNQRIPGEWRAGYVARDLAKVVAPAVDSARLDSWRHPGELSGVVSTSDPKFGLFLIPSRLITRGPDLARASERLNLGFGPATDRQVDYILSLLGAGPSASGLMTQHSKSEQAVLLRRVGNPTAWRERETWRALDQHQASIAIDALQGSTLWSLASGT